MVLDCMITHAVKFMPHCAQILIVAQPLCGHVTKTTCFLYYTSPSDELSVGCVFSTTQENVHAFTFSQDLRDLGVACTEGAVDLEAISIIQE